MYNLAVIRLWSLSPVKETKNFAIQLSFDSEEIEMKIFIVFALVIAVALAAPSSEVAPFIFGGVNALPGEFPFLVSIQHCFLGCSHICGGSIMTPIWVLTAAHCLTETSTRGSIDVFAGRHNLNHNEATEQRIEIEPNRWIIHPGWTSGRNFGPNDIALVSFM